jgi:anti-sigma regulatory factor (Ser/Thr protein kinase)
MDRQKRTAVRHPTRTRGREWLPTGSRVFPSAPQAAGAARRFLRELATGHVSPDLLGKGLLLTTELVTNAVRHGDPGPEDAVEVIVTLGDDRLRVAVRDRGPGFDPETDHVRTDEGGWGLDLVEAVASRWGVGPAPGVNEVWFEIEGRASDT